MVAQCWVKNIENGSSEHSKIRSGTHRKTGCYHSCIRDDERVFYQTEDLTRTHQHLKIASVAMLIGGALANALAFTGSSYLINRLSKDSNHKQRNRHDLAIEQLQKAQIK